MKKKKIIITAALFLSLCFLTGVKSEDVKANGIVIENPDDIVQYQLGTMRMDVRQEELEEILSGLETVIPADEESQKSLQRGDDFLAILLIHEDGQKDIFHFFQENEKWYMQTGDGELYENADFITDIIHVESADSGETAPSGYTGLSITEEGLFRMIQTDKAEKLAAYAKKEGFYPTEEEIAEEMERYLSEYRKSPEYKERAKACELAGYELEELLYSQNDFLLRIMVEQRFGELRRIEYMEGTDTIDGVVYSDFNQYVNAFSNKYVYQKEELNETLKEAYTQQKK